MIIFAEDGEGVRSFRFFSTLTGRRRLIYIFHDLLPATGYPQKSVALTRDIIAAVSRVNATDICRYPRAHATDIETVYHYQQLLLHNRYLLTIT